MSLNGLDGPILKEAHEYAVGEAGRWFLLNYTDRNDVNLFSRGDGGLCQIREQLASHDEPLFIFLNYRERNVLVKYIPDESSRLVQARVTVHFGAVIEWFEHDATVSISSAKELRSKTIAKSLELPTPTPSVSSVISEEAEPEQDVAEVDEIPVENAPSDLPDADKDQEVDGLAFHDETPKSDISPDVQPPPQPEEPLNRPVLAPLPQTVTNGLNSYDDDDFQDDSRPSSPTKPINITNTAASSQVKQMTKIGPRPSNDLSSHTSPFRPVSTLPAGVKLFSRSSKRPSPVESPPSPIQELPQLTKTLSHPEATQHTTMNELLPSTHLTPCPARPTTSSGVSVMSTRSNATTRTAAMGPEKAKLMKALELRKRKRAAPATSSKALAETVQGNEGEEVPVDDLPSPEVVSSVDSTKPADDSETGERDAPDVNIQEIESQTETVSELKPVMLTNMVDDADESKISSPIESSLISDSMSHDEVSSATSHSEQSEEKPEANQASQVPEVAESITTTQDVTKDDVVTADFEQQAHSITAEDATQASQTESLPASDVADTQPVASPEPDCATIDDASAATQQSKPVDTVTPESTATAPVTDIPSGATTGSQTAEPQPEASALTKPKLTINSKSRPVSEVDFLNDDQLMDELQSATVQEAKPMSVSKSPVRAAFPLDSNRRGGFPALRVSSAGSIPSAGANESLKEQNSLRSVSASAFNSRNGQSQNTPLLKKGPSVGSSISQRIKALEKLSASAGDVSGSRSASPSGTPSATFINVRQSSAGFGRTTPSVSRANSVVRHTPGSITTPGISPDSSSRPSSRAMTPLNRDFYNDSYTQLRESPGGFDQAAGSASRSPSRRLSVSMRTAAFNSGYVGDRRPVSTFMANGSAEPPVLRRSNTDRDDDWKSAERPAVSRSHTDSSSASQTNGHSHRLSRDFSRPALAPTPLPGMSPDTRDESPEKRGGRASRMLQRMSLSLSSNKKNDGATQANSLKEVAEPRASASIQSSKSATPASTPGAFLEMGDVNVQFPENLLWKRRSLKLDAGGFLLLVPAQSGLITEKSAGLKKYHLSEFRQAAIPDMDAQEMPNSVVMNFARGSGLQFACEDRAGQSWLLQRLQEAHQKWGASSV